MAQQQDDTELLRAFGENTIRDFICLIVATWVVALYSWLVIKCGIILLHKDRRRNKVAIFTWTLVLTMYCMKMTLWFIDTRGIVADLNTVLVQHSTDSLEQKQNRANRSLRRMGVVEDVLYAYMVVVGDTIVLWRVYAFWHLGRDIIVLAIPAAVYLASIVCAGLVTYCAAQSSTDLTFGAFTHPPFCKNIQGTSYWMQFSMAAVATILIAYKTWTYRRMVKVLVGNDVIWKSPVSKAMLIMLDTGLIYTLFFLAEAVLGVIDLPTFLSGHPTRQFALQIYQYQTSAIVGIYPTVIVILVHTHTQSFLMDSQGLHTISSLQFDSSRSGRTTGVNVITSRRTADWRSHDPREDGGDVRSRRSGKLHSSGNRELQPAISLHELRTTRSSSGGDFEDDDDDVDAKSGAVKASTAGVDA